MPRGIDVVGVWHGTRRYQVGLVSSTADGVIVACGPAGRQRTYPKSGHRHTKDPSSSPSTWYERQVLSDVTLAHPLHIIAFSGECDVRERSEEHTSELQSRQYLVCRLLLEKKK